MSLTFACYQSLLEKLSSPPPTRFNLAETRYLLDILLAWSDRHDLAYKILGSFTRQRSLEFSKEEQNHLHQIIQKYSVWTEEFITVRPPWVQKEFQLTYHDKIVYEGTLLLPQ